MSIDVCNSSRAHIYFIYLVKNMKNGKQVVSRKSKTHSTPWLESAKVKGLRYRLSTTTTTIITSEETKE